MVQALIDNSSTWASSIATVRQWIHEAQHVAVLTGAGVSAESGVPTFRDDTRGYWAKFKPEEMASEAGYRKDPPHVWRWYEHRRAQIDRWLEGHPSSPGLLLASARVAQAQGQWPQAESLLHRAIAQGAGAPAWEALGNGAAQLGDEPRARLAYANALRSQRGEALHELPGRDMRQQIADTAAIEERDEHGMPRLRG